MKKTMIASSIKIMNEYQIHNINQSVYVIFQIEHIEEDKYFVEIGALISEQIRDGE